MIFVFYISVTGHQAIFLMVFKRNKVHCYYNIRMFKSRSCDPGKIQMNKAIR